MPIVFDLLRAYERNQTLHAACELNLFDTIADHGGEIDVQTLGEKVGCKGTTGRLERFCNLCCSIGLLEKSQNTPNEKVKYRNSKESEAWLVSRNDTAQLGVILSQKTMYFTSLRYDTIVKSILADKSHGFMGDEENGNEEKEDFGAMYEDKDKFLAFALFMDNIGMTLKDDLKSLPLEKYQKVVDLGGCLGAVARCLKRHFPHMTVTLTDLETPITFAPEFKLNKGVDMKYQVVDFFKGDLPSADLYVLGHILHDWDDKNCLTILDNVKKALQPGGAILVLDCLLDDDRNGPAKTCEIDLHMLTLMSGKERTGTEFRALLEQAGFNNIQLYPLNENYWYDAVMAFV